MNGCGRYLHFIHFCLVIAGGDLEVWVITGGPELVPCHHKEGQGSQLPEQLIQPLILEWHSYLHERCMYII